MFYYRLSKYDPSFRDAKGAYLLPDWTSISDIGNKIDNKILSSEEYEEVEKKYLDVISGFIKDNNVKKMQIVGLEVNKLNNKFKNNEFVDENGCIIISQSSLREEIWCKLESDSLLIHFGYDFYVYFGSEKEYNKPVPKGLFLEENFISPYLQHNGN